VREIVKRETLEARKDGWDGPVASNAKTQNSQELGLALIN
jgi:hypothetical protein